MPRPWMLTVPPGRTCGTRLSFPPRPWRRWRSPNECRTASTATGFQHRLGERCCEAPSSDRSDGNVGSPPDAVHAKPPVVLGGRQVADIVAPDPIGAAEFERGGERLRDIDRSGGSDGLDPR